MNPPRPMKFYSGIVTSTRWVSIFFIFLFINFSGSRNEHFWGTFFVLFGMLVYNGLDVMLGNRNSESKIYDICTVVFSIFDCFSVFALKFMYYNLPYNILLCFFVFLAIHRLYKLRDAIIVSSIGVIQYIIISYALYKDDPMVILSGFLILMLLVSLISTRIKFNEQSEKIWLDTLYMQRSKEMMDILYKVSSISQKLNDCLLKKDILKVILNDVPYCIKTVNLALIFSSDLPAESTIHAAGSETSLDGRAFDFTSDLDYLTSLKEYRFIIKGDQHIKMSTLLSVCPESSFILEPKAKFVYVLKLLYPQDLNGFLVFNSDTQYPQETIQILGLLIKQMGISLSNSRIYEKANDEATRDALTSLRTRRFMKDFISKERISSETSNKSFAVFFFDIDNFKKFNDTYGHKIGDDVLKIIAKETVASVRSSDLVCRYGGEEFVVILPDTSQEIATIISERIRKSVEEVNLKELLKIDARLTISIGVALYPFDETNTDRLLVKADWAMYKAKVSGKNRVVFFSAFKDDYANNVIDDEMGGGDVLKIQKY